MSGDLGSVPIRQTEPNPPPVGSTMPTVREQLLARAGDDSPGLLFEDRSWTWAEVVRESGVRSAVLGALLSPGRPPHVGVLLENVPEFAFLLGGAALGRVSLLA